MATAQAKARTGEFAASAGCRFGRRSPRSRQQDRPKSTSAAMSVWRSQAVRADALKLRVEWNGRAYQLEVEHDHFRLSSRKQGRSRARSGKASVVEVRPGCYSILVRKRRELHGRSGGQRRYHEVLVRIKRATGITLTDPRDSRAAVRKTATVRPWRKFAPQMPGKIVKVLVKEGADGRERRMALMVVEAMKMQNEMKSPKDGMVRSVHVAEGHGGKRRRAASGNRVADYSLRMAKADCKNCVPAPAGSLSKKKAYPQPNAVLAWGSAGGSSLKGIPDSGELPACFL